MRMACRGASLSGYLLGLTPGIGNARSKGRTEKAEKSQAGGVGIELQVEDRLSTCSTVAAQLP